MLSHIHHILCQARRVAVWIMMMAAAYTAIAADNALLMAQTEPPPSITDEHRQYFENWIRPLLVQHCLDCHAGSEAEAGLRLDSRAGWVTGGDSGPAIVPGHPEQSRLIEAIRYQNVDLQMPPDGRLPQADVDKLMAWVRMGAPDPRVESSADSVAQQSLSSDFDIAKRMREHWAWQPARDVPLPRVTNASWPLDEIDRFILARLEQSSLAPAAPADKAAWLRRVSFGVVGLAPTPAELQEFLNDDSPAAYARAVDRLLQSPRYGEHWGQHWLDLCRFAETRGHEQDAPIPEAYRFRDYVIQAFNEDVPYDQLIIEHIAGDLVEQPRLHPVDRTNQSIQGTGFWHLHEATHSPVDIRGDEADRVHNQLDVFSRTFLGLSLGCARCHDHKFDPVATRDYYAMFGFLQSSSFQLADVSDPELQQSLYEQLEDLRDAHAEQLKALAAETFRKQLSDWSPYLVLAATQATDGDPSPVPTNAPQASEDAAPPDTEPLSTDTVAALVQHLHTVIEQPDDPLHALTRPAVPIKQSEPPRTSQNVHVVEDFLSSDPQRWIVSGFRFGSRPLQRGELVLGAAGERPIERVLGHASAEAGAVSAAFSGFLRTRTFEVTGPRLWYRYRGEADVFLAVDSHRLVSGPLHGVVRQQLRGDAARWQWHEHPVGDYQGHRVHVEFTPRGRFALDCVVFSDSPPKHPPTHASAGLAFRHVAPHDGQLDTAAGETIGVFRRAIDAWCDGSLKAEQAAAVQWLVEHAELLPPVAELPKLAGEAHDQYWQQRRAIEARIPKPVYALALLDGSGEDEPVHIRGNHRNRAGTPVPRSTLLAFGGDRWPRPLQGSGRMQLAKSLVHPDNPLVARVMVNRIWHHMFGRGLVETVDDFGAMGKTPSHPELLDYLAREFIRDRWSIKRLIRRIALSQTYRMSSRSRSDVHLTSATETNDFREERDGSDGSDRAAELEPTNLLLHRMHVRRLPAEAIRDHILAVSGQLNNQMHGRSVMVHITPFMRGNRSPQTSGPLDGDRRRSIYTEVRRNHLSSFLSTFDKPAPFMSIGRRTQSNSPAQALALMNDPFVHEQAAHWAERLLEAELSDDADRVEWAYLTAYSRGPTVDETAMALEFLAAQQARYAKDGAAEPRRAAWIDLCHTWMNVKEFYHIY